MPALLACTSKTSSCHFALLVIEVKEKVVHDFKRFKTTSTSTTITSL